MQGLKLTDRDYSIFREIDRWRITLSRHIKEIAGFTTQRTCERRLKKLVDAGYLEYHKIIYGIPRIYQNTRQAEVLAQIQLSNWKRKIKIEQIAHDITVLDTAIALHQKMGISYKDMITERQSHQNDGFGVRSHHPDFICKHKNESICVEIELSMKAKNRFEKNIKDNFRAYDVQLWVVQNKNNKISKFLEEQILPYPNIKIIELKEVLEHGFI